METELLVGLAVLLLGGGGTAAVARFKARAKNLEARVIHADPESEALYRKEMRLRLLVTAREAGFVTKEAVSTEVHELLGLEPVRRQRAPRKAAK